MLGICNPFFYSTTSFCYFLVRRKNAFQLEFPVELFLCLVKINMASASLWLVLYFLHSFDLKVPLKFRFSFAGGCCNQFYYLEGMVDK